MGNQAEKCDDNIKNLQNVLKNALHVLPVAKELETWPATERYTPQFATRSLVKDG